MNTKEFALILNDALGAFEKWYETEGNGGDKEALQKAYTAAHFILLRRVSEFLHDDKEVYYGKNCNI